MRECILTVSLMLILASCKKEDNNSGSNFSNAKGTTINLSQVKWFTTKSTNGSNGFGSVFLILSGTTNADKVTVETYGDGMIGEQDLVLDLKKSFTNDTIGISFTHFSGTIPTDEFEKNTKLKVYKGNDTLVETLNSGKLRY